LLIGMAQSGTTYAVIYGVIGRQVAPEKRSWAMGVTAAAGSFGQFLMVPVENWLIGHTGLAERALHPGAMALAIMPLALGLREPPSRRGLRAAAEHGAALREAFAYPSFRLLTAGYFVCGFQVVFIGVHLPSYLKDQGLSPNVATTALALIGLFNVFGTYAAAARSASVGQAAHPGRHLRAARCGHRGLRAGAADALERVPVLGGDGRAVAVHGAAHQCHRGADLRRAVHVDAGRLRLPQSPGGQLPGRVAGRQAVRHDRQLHIVWWLAVALSVFATLANLPVREAAITRPAPQPA
jgi:hypothetical protein